MKKERRRGSAGPAGLACQAPGVVGGWGGGAKQTGWATAFPLPRVHENCLGVLGSPAPHCPTEAELRGRTPPHHPCAPPTVWAQNEGLGDAPGWAGVP